MKLHKKQNPTKEQLTNDIKRMQDVKNKRAFVKNSFFPALVKASDSVDDAKFFLGSFSNLIMESFLAEMKTKNFMELKLHEKLDKKHPKYKEMIDLLGLFSSENVYDSRELVEGMKQEIEMMITDEFKKRKLDSLTTNFLE